MLSLDLFTGDTCASMALTHQGTALQVVVRTISIERPEHLGPNHTMTDIRLSAETLDAGGVAFHDTDVVEHRGLLEKLHIELQFRMQLGYLQASVCHLTGVNQQDPLQLIIIWIILVNDRFVIHSQIIWHGLHGFHGF